TLGGGQEQHAIALCKSLYYFKIAPDQLEPIGYKNPSESGRPCFGPFEQQSILRDRNKRLAHRAVGMRHNSRLCLIDVAPYKLSKGSNLPVSRVPRQDKCRFLECVLEVLPLTEKNNPVADHPGIAECLGSRHHVERPHGGAGFSPLLKIGRFRWVGSR